MTYQLKGGEEVRSGILFGWTGQPCPDCHGCGEDRDARACRGCGGTGELWGKMPIQPADLPPDTE